MQRSRTAELKRKRPLDRVANACQRCRKQKIKCSGSNPCKTCQARGTTCEFEADERKVLVTEKYLNSLKDRLQRLENQRLRLDQQETALPHLSEASERLDDHPVNVTADNEALSDPEQDTGIEVQVDEPAGTAPHSPAGVAPNPLVSEKPAYILNVSGKLLYLGHSSTWAFGAQVLQMTRQHFQTSSPFLNGEAEAYELDHDDYGSVDLSGLPSLEAAVFLMSTVKYRLQPFFYLFDEQDFIAHVRRLYKNPSEYAKANRLHLVHFLVIMALGKSLSSTTQAGLNLFNRALKLLPDITELCLDPVLPIEVMCSIAIFLECIDHRCAAYTMIGQAMRVAQIHGLHTDHQVEEMGEHLVQRFRRLWWTLYSIDRRFSAMIGLAQSLHDQDITSPLPDPSSFDEPFVLSVRLSQQTGKAVNTIYGVNGRLNRALLPTAQSVIRDIAGLSDDIAAFSESCFGEISRTAAHLNLAYHQCIILTTRPFLFYLLQRRLGKRTPANTSTFPLSASTKGLVQVCIDSAVQIVTTLSNLQQHDLLDTFLPFDLDTAFSSSFVLLLAVGIHPRLVPNLSLHIDTTYRILDSMSMKGNLLAALRRSEIEELRGMLDPANSITDPVDPTATGTMAQTDRVAEAAPEVALHTNTVMEADLHGQNGVDTASLPSLGDPFFNVWNLNNDGVGFSGEQLLTLADELGNEDWGDLWLGEQFG